MNWYKKHWSDSDVMPGELLKDAPKVRLPLGEAEPKDFPLGVHLDALIVKLVATKLDPAPRLRAWLKADAPTVSVQELEQKPLTFIRVDLVQHPDGNTCDIKIQATGKIWDRDSDVPENAITVHKINWSGRPAR